MKTSFLVFFLAGTFLVSAQNQLNKYKYVVVPKKFDAFKRENQYQTSTLVKYLLTKKGFNTVYDDTLPEDLKMNRCLGLYTDLLEDSSMFSTKVTLSLKDCDAKEVFVTQQGTSKIKEFKPAYNDAVREAFKSFDAISYSYTPKTNGSSAEEPITVSFKNDVKQLDPPKESEKTSAVEAAQEAVPDRQTYSNPVPVPSEAVNTDDKMPEEMAGTNTQAGDVLYAQQISNGYQLVDSTPKIRMRIFKSSAKGFYMAETDSKNGIVYDSNGNWIFEYYEGDKLMTEELNIKF